VKSWTLVDPYRAIANNNRKRRFHRGKVIVAIRNGNKPQVHADERGFSSFYSSAFICDDLRLVSLSVENSR